jgi:8-oxo-dGTP diphosphatase
MPASDDARMYPERPYLAVSAAIVKDGKVLIVKRGRPPAQGIYTLPGGGVEVGEALAEAVIREAREEVSLEIAPQELAGFREVIMRDKAGKLERHFVVMCFAARVVSGEPTPNDEIAEIKWLRPAELAGLETTPGLAEIVDAAFVKLGEIA